MIDFKNIRETLFSNLTWSPFDFIRNISVKGDKEILINRLTAPMDEENDLRFIHSLPNNIDVAVFAERLPWDSAFYGYGIGRLNGIYPLSHPTKAFHANYDDAIKCLIVEAKARKIKYLFTFVDSRDLPAIRALGNLGFCLIESRVSYHRNIVNYDYEVRYPVRSATIDDAALLAQTAAKMINQYDRFHADPFITPQESARLMSRWVYASICENFADITIVPDKKDPAAFCTVKYHKSNWDTWKLKLSQPVFSAVGNEFKGWYRKIISETTFHLRDIGAEHSFLTTQVTNYPVIWVWESLGYHFGKCEYVFRFVI